MNGVRIDLIWVGNEIDWGWIEMNREGIDMKWKGNAVNDQLIEVNPLEYGVNLLGCRAGWGCSGQGRPV